MGRKDRERYLRLKNENPGYQGFRGLDTVTTKAEPAMETVVCSTCSRRRNVASDTLPEDRSTYVCLQCQEDQQEAPAEAETVEAAE